jgi:hypothetical protein
MLKYNITIFWDVIPYSLVDIYQYRSGIYYLHLQVPPKCWELPIRLHGVTSRKTITTFTAIMWEPQIPHIYSQMTGDRHFVVEAERAARLQAAVNSAPVYFYQFGYRGRHSLSEVMSGTNINFGMTSHNRSMHSHSVHLLHIKSTVGGRGGGGTR